MTILQFPTRAICTCADCQGTEFITIQSERLPCPSCRAADYHAELQTRSLATELELAGNGRGVL